MGLLVTGGGHPKGGEEGVSWPTLKRHSPDLLILPFPFSPQPWAGEGTMDNVVGIPTVWTPTVCVASPLLECYTCGVPTCENFLQ
eukprot:270824-Pyramimonas_sp.AAC.1